MRALAFICFLFGAVACDQSGENLRSQASNSTQYRSHVIPADLQDLIPYARKWGIGDDVERDRFLRNASHEEKIALAQALKGRNARITQWLNSWPDREMPEEAGAFMYMQLSLTEMGLWVD